MRSVDKLARKLNEPFDRTRDGRGARALHVALGVARDALHGDAAASSATRAALSEQSGEKRSWLRTYRGVALVLEGVLMMLGRDAEYTAAVPHLTAPGGRKKTDGVPNAPARPSQQPTPA